MDFSVDAASPLVDVLDVLVNPFIVYPKPPKPPEMRRSTYVVLRQPL